MKTTIKGVDPTNLAVKNLLLYLQKKCLPSDKPCAMDQGYWWIAYTEDNLPIGFAGLSPSSRWLDTGYLCRAGVIPTHTGHGIQKKLIRVRISKAKKLNWNWLITDTTANPASSNSLIHQGFKLYEPTVSWAYRNSLYWRLNISKDK